MVVYATFIVVKRVLGISVNKVADLPKFTEFYPNFQTLTFIFFTQESGGSNLEFLS